MGRLARLKRLWIYVGDCIIVLALWTVINNLVGVPGIEGVLQFGGALTCFFYFLLFERPGLTQASLLKRRFKLEVVRVGEFENLSWSQSAGRAAIGALGFIPWDSAGGMPWSPGWVAFQVPFALVVCVLLYGICEMWCGNSTRLPHDILTGTAVVASNRDRNVSLGFDPLVARTSFIANKTQLWICLVPILGLLVFSYVNRPTNVELELAEQAQSVSQAFTDLVSEQLHMRTAIEISSVVESNGLLAGSAVVRNVLLVKIWIPFVEWNPSDRDAVLQAVAANLHLEPGRYDVVQFNLWTGGLYTLGLKYEIPAP